MKTKPSPCCSRCFKDIAVQSTMSARLWLKLCDLFIKLDGDLVENAILEFTHSLTDVDLSVRELEINKFLVSTESKSGMNIKLLGFNNGLFCVNQSRHD